MTDAEKALAGQVTASAFFYRERSLSKVSTQLPGEEDVFQGASE
jgi:hypothetical protein